MELGRIDLSKLHIQIISNILGLSFLTAKVKFVSIITS
jgi:hypothetical protein